MSEQYTLVKTVTFSGKFPLILSTADLALCRRLILDVQVSRFPLSPYFSAKSNPPQGFFATICEVQDNFVVRRHDVTYERQRFAFTGGDDEQNIPTQICIGKKHTQNLTELARALGIPLFAVNDPYTDALTPLGNFSREYYFQCYADTGLTVSVHRLNIESCSSFSQTSNDPVSTPALIPSVTFSPGSAIPGTLYSPNEGQNPGDYQPYPGDGIGMGVEVPFGEACSAYEVVIEITDQSISNSPFFVGFQVWGIIEGLSLDPNPGDPSRLNVNLICGDQTVTACVQQQRVTAWVGTPGEVSGRITSIEPL